MADFDKTNKGSLFKNYDKKPNDPATEKWGDYTGSINIDGKEYWITGWLNTAGSDSKIAGEKYFGLAVKPKEAQAPKGDVVITDINDSEPMPDLSDIPF